MDLHAWITILVLAACLGLLVLTHISPTAIFVGSMTALLLTGILTTTEALAGFANPGVITIAALYVVAAGLRQTGAIAMISDRLFGKPGYLSVSQLRIMLPVTVMSAFMNNTPIVASFVPAIQDWARKHQLSASRFLLPLSYAAILGGTITLIGTSTNLVVNGLLFSETGRQFGFFELAWLGIPSALIGFAYVFVFGRQLLPARISAEEQLADPREYTVEMLVENECPLVGKTIEDAGLRNLPGLYLIELNRRNNVLPAVNPHEVIESGDRLVFAGITESVADLQKIRGLVPATNQVFKLESDRSSRTLVEVVISRSADFANKTIKQLRFRNRFDAVVIAVSREGKRINRKIGDITLEPGDTLLLETDSGFVEQQRNAKEFLLIKPLDGAVTFRHQRRSIAWLILLAIISSAGFGWLDILQASLAGAGLMIMTGCLSGSDAGRSIDYEVLIVIACAFSLGVALEKSGAASFAAQYLLALAGNNPFAILAIVYISTAILTEMITNNAAAALMFPLAYATSTSLGLDFMPFAVAIAFAASASFSTPIGYQTNLMVYGPGGYRFTDYLRFGLPLNICLAATAILIIPNVWPLS